MDSLCRTVGNGPDRSADKQQADPFRNGQERSLQYVIYMLFAEMSDFYNCLMRYNNFLFFSEYYTRPSEYTE